MLNIFICDDVEEELNDLLHILNQCTYEGGLTVKGFLNPYDILNFCELKEYPDVAVLDIMMPLMSGIELAQSMRKEGYGGQIIFLTTTNDFASQSYQVKAFTYLLKPVTKYDIQDVLNQIQTARNANDAAAFKLVRKSGVRSILFSELIYVEVQNHNLNFHMVGGGTITLYASLNEYMDKLLVDPRIAQPNRSYLVNMDYVSACERQKVTLNDGTQISISRNYPEFRSRCFEWMFKRNQI